MLADDRNTVWVLRPMAARKKLSVVESRPPDRSALIVRCPAVLRCSAATMLLRNWSDSSRTDPAGSGARHHVTGTGGLPALESSHSPGATVPMPRQMLA